MFIYNRFATEKFNYTIITEDNSTEKNYRQFKASLYKSVFVYLTFVNKKCRLNSSKKVQAVRALKMLQLLRIICVLNTGLNFRLFLGFKVLVV